MRCCCPCSRRPTRGTALRGAKRAGVHLRRVVNWGSRRWEHERGRGEGGRAPGGATDELRMERETQLDSLLEKTTSLARSCEELGTATGENLIDLAWTHTRRWGCSDRRSSRSGVRVPALQALSLRSKIQLDPLPEKKRTRRSSLTYRDVTSSVSVTPNSSKALQLLHAKLSE